MALFSRPTPERIRAVIGLRRTAPDLHFQMLVAGVDNIRHDVHLSPAFVQFCGSYILRLYVKHSTAGELLQQKPPVPGIQDRNEFKRLVRDVLLTALTQAKLADNPDVDLLANVAVFKFLLRELQQQYTRIVLEGKEKLKMYEGPRHERNVRAFQLKETFSTFQANRRNVQRRVASEVLASLNEVQADAVRKTRESFFGDQVGQWFAFFSNPLAFTESGRDDFIHLEKYVMLGNFNRDPDRYESVESWLKSMLKWLDAAGPEARELETRQQEHNRIASELEALRQQAAPSTGGLARLFGSRSETPATPANLATRISDSEQRVAQSEEQLRVLHEAYDALIGEMLNVPENADELFGTTRTEQQLADARARRAHRDQIEAIEEKLQIQRYLSEEFYSSAQQMGLLPCIAAAYQCASIYQDFCPPINPQQLKHALLDPVERKKVAALMVHYKLPPPSEARLDEAAAQVRSATPRELHNLLARFISDFMRHHRDARLLTVMQNLLDRVNLAMDEKTRELSRINSTLYEFLLPDERRPQDDRVLGHVIVKADVRDSTRTTAELLQRGLNPASHFSLNFFDPLNKLLSRYGAEKVFIEGDAVILAMFETETSAAGAYPVARACGLAREMMEVVKAWNSRADGSGLPRLDIGIGICWQESAPMYLLDGETRIMISSAINLADRLSGCSKLARRALQGLQSPFDVYVFQTITDEAAGGAIEEFLVRFNTGVCLSEEAFRKLQLEISLKMVELELPALWQTERVRLHCGCFPLSQDVFQRIVIREAVIPYVDATDFSVKDETDRRYYELCTSRAVYDHTEQALSRATPV